MLHKRSLRHRYLGSFLSILIPVILFSVIILQYSLSSGKRQVDETRHVAFSRATETIGSILDRFDLLLEDTERLANCFVPAPDGGHELNESRLFAALEWLEKNLLAGTSVLCYQRGSQYAYHNGEKMAYHEYERQYGGYNLVGSRFFTTLVKSTKPTLLHVPAVHPEVTEGLVAYIHPVSFPAYGESLLVAFLLPESVFGNQFAEYVGDIAGDLYVYDGSHNTIYERHGAAGQAVVMPLKEVYRLKGVGVLPGQGNAVAVRELLSQRGLTFVMVLPSGTFYSGIRQERYVLSGMIVLLMLTCAAAAVLAARYNYKPIRSLVQETIGADAFPPEGNELEMIKDHFIRAREEKESLTTRLFDQNEIVLGQLCEKLIYGKVADAAELAYLTRCADIAFSRPHNIALYIVPVYPAAGPESEDAVIRCCQAFLPAEAVTACSELLRERGICLLINFGTAGGDAKARAAGLAEALYARLMEDGMAVSIGGGLVYADPMDLRDSWLEAVAALPANEGMGPGIYWYAEAGRATPEDAVIPQMAKALLIESFRRGDQAVAQRTFREIVDNMQRSLSALLFHFQCAEMIGALIDSAQRMGIVPDSKQLAFLAMSQSPPEYIEGGSALIASLCGEIRIRLQRGDTERKAQLLRYISEAYCRSEFSLQMVIEAQKLSKTKINAILKEDVGMGFSRYVSWLRLNEFKRLLMETNRSIQELVCEVGYLDVSSFLRKFKESEGITAGQFRDHTRLERLAGK